MDPTPLDRKSAQHGLAKSLDAQDETFRHAFRIIRDAIKARAFPACTVAVTHRSGTVAWRAFGTFTYNSESAAVCPETIFDIASLTKVVATTTMAMVLYERGLLDLEAPIAAVVPEFVNPEHTDSDARLQVTPHMLLAHTAGLPAHKKFYLQSINREDLLRAAFSTPLVAEPGSRAEYSDIGFIILGIVLERLADEKLSEFCQREIFGPVGMTQTTFNPSQTIRNLIPPTAREGDRIIQGEVQDQNARVLEGVAGHAGLFSSAKDLARFAQTMLDGGHPIVRASTVELFSRREPSPPGTSRALGWDTPSAPSQSGRYFSSRSFGHLGYTGTSLWIDPERGISITLLTNRTWPDCTNDAIKRIRPAFHDAVMEGLGIVA